MLLWKSLDAIIIFVGAIKNFRIPALTRLFGSEMKPELITFLLKFGDRTLFAKTFLFVQNSKISIFGKNTYESTDQLFLFLWRYENRRIVTAIV